MLSGPRVGLIGAGAIADTHVAAYRAAGVPIRVVASRRLGSAQRLAGLADGARATTRVEDVLEDPAVDAVDICTPTDSHAALTIAAARAGKHVHVEKPMALSLTDADAMLAACREAGVRLMVGQTARYLSVHRALRAAVDAGDVGRPFHLEVVWDHGNVWPGGWRGWQFDRVRSGGHLVHNGTHAFDLACWLLGARPLRVFAQGRAVAHPAMETHDYWRALVTFEGGARAVCEMGYVLRPLGAIHRLASLYGTAGAAHHTTLDDGVLYVDGGAQSFPLAVDQALRAQLADWVACLRGDRPAPVTGEDGRRALAVGLAAQESVDSGQPVEVPA
jgi:predicted dehydrogenase